ncbi:MAG TPA: aminotransferase class V-fold PLP-dependent enzyme [Gammaproteobacteria bacterium]|nr:aminotransferase class V-fold PLP-dependent enzyme [Gammaproteobacteria bacterium]
MHPEFQLDKNIIHLNHAAVSPWPARTVKAVSNFANENYTQGSLGYLEWVQTENRLRERMSRLVNASSTDDIALLKNTSEGLSVIAYGIDWQDGDNVVIPANEFPSNRIVWESLCPLGVDVRQIDIQCPDPEAALIAAMDGRTRLLSVSAVQYATGLRLLLEVLGVACNKRSILFCVDAIQQLGALRFDTQQCQADFIVADAHKWMLGPEGLALFYSKPAARERLKLSQFGWHMVEQMGDFSRTDWLPASSARRFECGSPNTLGVYATEASLSLIDEVGMDSIESQVLENSRWLCQQIEADSGLELISDPRAERLSGIVTFRPLKQTVESVYKKISSAGVICVPRGGGIRFSPHFYTDRSLIEQAMACL